jgi:hypothetical protein
MKDPEEDSTAEELAEATDKLFVAEADLAVAERAEKEALAKVEALEAELDDDESPNGTSGPSG